MNIDPGFLVAYLAGTSSCSEEGKALLPAFLGYLPGLAGLAPHPWYRSRSACSAAIMLRCTRSASWYRMIILVQ